MQTVTVPSDSPVEDQAYIDEMVAKGSPAVDAGSNQDRSTQSKPDGIPEKFWNAMTGEVDTAGLAKSYTELEKRFSQPKPKTEATEVDTEDNPAAPAEDTSENKAEAIVESAGLDMQVLSKEFADKGELSTDAYTKLDKAGIPKDMVDQYIAGQKALQEQVQLRAYSEVGGQQEYVNMVTWAQGNLSASETKAFNLAVSGDQDQINLAVRGLRDKYTQANGRDPSRSLSGSSTNTGTKSFGSRAELTTAMSDPRYSKDEAYRKSIERRLAASDGLF
jgi:hypothetical protein